MISHLNGGNTMQPPEPVLSRVEWEAQLSSDEWEAARAVDAAVSFASTVTGARLIVRCGTNPVIAAAAVHRAWFAERCADRVTVPGVPDELVSAVQFLCCNPGSEGGHVPHSQ